MLYETCPFYFQKYQSNFLMSDSFYSTGLPLSTYFSGIKLRWMIDNYPGVAEAHDADDLLFGTIESWVAYVRSLFEVLFLMPVLTYRPKNRTSWEAQRRAFTSVKSRMHRAHCS